ncbi:SDR family oxidoreductase [Rosenbergiella epipactidis]|uniref:SDR family oxidoreductase n=1 Tax=Rosenbergiella epipactidis TaxID=1544694 RepID=UPI001F4E35C0|nr:SDR family oxidoreductase [Rosenbergiella epipactidis]
MSNSHKIALITGANKGIGFEIANKLGREGIKVYVGARNATRGEDAAQKLRNDGISATFILVDLNDHNSILDAAEKIKKTDGHLDILVNNAGIIDPKDGVPSDSDIDTIKSTFETNFYGTLLVTQSMLPLLKASKNGRIVNISSGLGSLALNSDPSWEFSQTKLIGYNASKAALNMLTVQLAWELKDTPIKVNAANPNFTDTELVPGATGGRPVSEGAKTAIGLALIGEDGPTGKFFEDYYNNEECPW